MLHCRWCCTWSPPTTLGGEDDPITDDQGTTIIYSGAQGITRDVCREFVRRSHAANDSKPMKPASQPFRAIRCSKLFQRCQVRGGAALYLGTTPV